METVCSAAGHRYNWQTIKARVWKGKKVYLLATRSVPASVAHLTHPFLAGSCSITCKST
jgi:hypothetical protein